MASITIRRLPESVHRALKLRAARNGRSTEAEVRTILAAATQAADDQVSLGTRLASVAQEAAALTDEEICQLEELRSRKIARMKEAISEYVAGEENREALIEDALTSLRDFEADGMHLTYEEVKAWMETWWTDQEQDMPPCHA